MGKIDKETREQFSAKVRKSTSEGRVLIRHHARVKMRKRGIYINDVTDILMKGEIIEVYPKDRPFPSCLIYSKVGGRPVHVVCSLSKKEAIVVTAYEPDPKKWIDFKIRKR